jgi:hypothetical protein
MKTPPGISYNAVAVHRGFRKIGPLKPTSGTGKIDLTNWQKLDATKQVRHYKDRDFVKPL